MICEYEKYILDFIDGNLNEKKAKEIMKHLNDCVECSAKFENIKSIDAIIKNELTNVSYTSSKDKIMDIVMQRSSKVTKLSRLYNLRKCAYAVAIIIFIVVSIHFVSTLLYNANLISHSANNSDLNKTSDKQFLDAETLKPLGITIKDGPPASCKISKQDAISIANDFTGDLYKMSEGISAQYNLCTDNGITINAISKDAIDADPILKSKQKIEDIPVWIVSYQGVSASVKGYSMLSKSTNSSITTQNKFTIVIVDAISGKVLERASSSKIY
ncbi:MAG: hypothetical protein Q8900_07170 [Bacillota bacterium]|nr:hypothetical protein [Bacillota bacterium]